MGTRGSNSTRREGTPTPERPHRPKNLLFHWQFFKETGSEKGLAAKIPTQGSARAQGGVAKAVPEWISSRTGRRVSEAGVPSAALGPPAPYPAHAYCRLATFQPMTHEARPRRFHFPLASQNTPVFQLRPVSRKHFLSAYGILLPCMFKYSPGSVGHGKNTLTWQGKQCHTHFTGGKREAQRS